MKTDLYRQEVTRTIKILPTQYENLLHMAYGISTETGELQDIFKKELAYGKSIDVVNFKEELGDILWYVFNGFNFANFTERELVDIEHQKQRIGDGIPKSIYNTKKLTMHLSVLVADFYKDLENSDIVIEKSEYVNLIDIKHDICSIYYTVLCICKLENFDVEEIMEMNINKLRIRFPEKFTQEYALNRNLEKERQSLENTKK